MAHAILHPLVDTWQLPVGVSNWEENQNHPPSPMPSSTCSTGGFYCHSPSAQGGLGMLPKEGKEEIVVALIKSDDSNKTQDRRNNLVFIKPINCSQLQAPWYQEDTKAAEVSSIV